MKESDEINDLIGRRFANNKYILTEYLSSGSFSLIYKVKEYTRTEELAAKLESIDTKTPQLSHEFAIYQTIRHECNNESIPKTYFFGEIGSYLALVMQLLGPSLALKFKECGQTFSVKTVTLLALQIIDIFQYLHSRRIIYRDVKPENFLLGLSETKSQNKLHLIDLGLAKQYKDIDGVHIPYREELRLVGTVRYMSINTHLGREQSRRDDMEAVGHLLIYFLKGSLPWSGLRDKNSKQLFDKIGKIKEEIKPEILCTDLPKEFCDYLKTVRSLEFTEEPNYKKFTQMFELLLNTRNEIRDEVYDWNNSKRFDNNNDKNKPNVGLNTENN